MTQAQMRAICMIAVMMAIPFAHLLDLGYLPQNPEPWIISVLYGLVGLGLALLTVNRRAFPWVYALVVYWFADANIYDGGWIVAILCLTVIFGLAFYMRRIEDWALPMTAVFAVMFSITAVVKERTELIVWTGAEIAADPAAVGKKPAIMHLVLDGFMSPLAVPDSIPPGHPAARMLEELQAKGFDIFGKAVSVSSKTRKSVSALMGLTDATDNWVQNEQDSEFTYSVKDNRLFDLMDRSGYDITALQNSFLELCVGPTEVRCGTYTRAARMDVFTRAGLSLPTRLQLAFVALYDDYLQQKSIHQVVLFDLASNIIARSDPSVGYFSRSLLMVDFLDQIRDGAYGPQAGQALVAHLLVPHRPYILNPDCTPKPFSEWVPQLRDFPGQDISEIYVGFWDQAACVMSRVNEIAEQAQQRGDMIVVLHGDHGSRVTEDSVLKNPDDMLMSFVATKFPGSTGKRTDEPLVLQTVLADFYHHTLTGSP